MNPYLAQLQPYPFEKLRHLTADISPPANLASISLGLGEPQHPTPTLINDALIANLSGLSHYPTTNGSVALRQAIADWLMQRYHLPMIDAQTQVLSVNGSREALFSFAQIIIDPHRHHLPAQVLCPNPFYQIYEGAALLAGAQAIFANSDPQRHFIPNLATLQTKHWSHIQLMYVCSPGNPSGAVLTLDDWREIFDLSERYGFVIAADECYSEIYFDEAHPPLGALQAAHQLGRSFERLMVFSSLSKRSNVPGMRSGFVAGDANLIKAFLQYRTYHGCAMSPTVQAASIAAWQNENHVRDNRKQYREKFAAVLPLLTDHLDVTLPDAGFYLWANVSKTGLTDTVFARQLLAQCNVTVLPGSYLARAAHGINPGEGYIRLALVAHTDACIKGAQRIAAFCKNLA